MLNIKKYTCKECGKLEKCDMTFKEVIKCKKRCSSCAADYNMLANKRVRRLK